MATRNELSIRERRVLDAYQSPERPTLAEIGRRFGISESAACHRLTKARAKVYANAAAAPDAPPMKLRPISLSLCYNV